MKNPFRKDKEPFKHKNVRLIVTGVCKEHDKEDLCKQMEAQGVKAVVTSVPVLGQFDI